MSIKTASILEAATAAFTGGTAAALSYLRTLNDGTGVRCRFGGTSFLTKKEVEFSATAPTVKSGAPNGWSQRRKTIRVKFPRTLANGNRTIETMEWKHSHDIEATDAEIDEQLKQFAQFLLDEDFSGFHHDSSTD